MIMLLDRIASSVLRYDHMNNTEEDQQKCECGGDLYQNGIGDELVLICYDCGATYA